MIHRDAVNILAWILSLAAVVYAWNAVKRFAPGSVGEAMDRARFRAPIQAASVLVGIAFLILVMEPVHLAGYDEVQILAAWRERLWQLAIAAVIAGLLSALFGGGMVMTGVSLAWPSGLYAALLWSLYLVFRQDTSPQLAQTIREVEAVAIPFLTLVSAFPFVLFAAGLAGGIAARSLLRLRESRG